MLPACPLQLRFLCVLSVIYAGYSFTLKQSQWKIGEQTNTSHQEPLACVSTVSYLFIVQDTIPLAQVWRKYFDGCPSGSYTVHVHSQSMVSSIPDLPEASILLDPTLGKLYWSYNMQEAMLKLYRAALDVLAPNGCKPRWMQMLSDSCAPVRSCRDMSHWAGPMGKNSSFIQAANCTNDICNSSSNSLRKPAAWDEHFFFKASQWSTLWGGHANLLVEHEAENKPIWANTETPDEHYTANILHKLGAHFVWRGLTYSHGFNDKGHLDGIECGTTPDGNFTYALTGAREGQKMFARKFRPSCVPALLQALTEPLTTWCQNGLISGSIWERGDTCCAASCGTCDGNGCSGRLGGASQCCVGHITSTCTSVTQVACKIPSSPTCGDGCNRRRNSGDCLTRRRYNYDQCLQAPTQRRRRRRRRSDEIQSMEVLSMSI